MSFESITSRITDNPAVLMLLLLAPLYGIGVTFQLLTSSGLKIKHILSTRSEHHVVLPYTPTERFNSLFTVLFSLGMLGMKHLGFGAKLPEVKADGTVCLPALSIAAPIVLKVDDVKLYNTAIRTIFSKSEPKGQITAEPTPLLLLAPLTSPLFPSLLLLSSNPIKPLGSVNVRNTFIFRRPDILHRLGRPGAESKGKLAAEAKMGGMELLGKRMKRGVEYDTIIDVSADSEPIFSFSFTTLALLRLPSSVPLYPIPSTSNLPSETEPTWQVDPLRLILPSSLTPMSWASLSKDYNPIHVSPFLARLFGLKRSIAHGNMILGMVMERATDNIDESSKAEDEEVMKHRTELGRLWSGSSGETGSSWLIVDFKRPVFVPSTIKIRWAKGRAQVFEEETESGSRSDSEGKDGGIRVLVDIRAGRGSEPLK